MHALLAAVVVYINSQITSDFNLPSSIVSIFSIPHVLWLTQITGPFVIYSRGSDAGLPKPDSLLKILGW